MSPVQLIGILGLICFIPLFSNAANSNAQVADCISKRDPWSQDSCRFIKTAKCSVEIQNDQQILVEIEGLSPLSSTLGKSYQLSGTQSGWVTRTNLNFGGDNRGMVQILENAKMGRKNILAVEVYINHDSSGATYTRYRCGNLQKNL